MTITIAGEKKEYAEGTTIAQFVDKDTFDTTIVKEGDSIEFLYFMGGGSF